MESGVYSEHNGYEHKSAKTKYKTNQWFLVEVLNGKIVSIQETCFHTSAEVFGFLVNLVEKVQV